MAMSQSLGPEATAPPSPPRTPWLGVPVGVVVTDAEGLTDGLTEGLTDGLAEVLGDVVGLMIPRRASASHAMPSSGP